MSNIVALTDTNNYEEFKDRINQLIVAANAEIVPIQVANLETNDKTSLVDAINEVNRKPNFLTFLKADGTQSNITLGA